MPPQFPDNLPQRDPGIDPMVSTQSNYGTTQGGQVSGTGILSGNIASPFLDNQELAGQTASFGAQAIPDAAAWQQELFSPGFNASENIFMNNEANRQGRMLEPALARAGHQFSGTPMHSGIMESQNTLMRDAAMNLGNTAGQVMMNRQGLAGQAAGRVLGSPLAATQQNQESAGGMLNTVMGINQMPTQQGLSYLGQTPIMSPTVVSSPGGSGGKK